MKHLLALIPLLSVAQVAPPPLPIPPPTNPPIAALTLAWDPSATATERTNITYRLYANLGGTLPYDARTNATSILHVTNATRAEVAVIRPGTWHFTVTAVDVNVESGFSNEVIHEQPAAPDAPKSLRSVTVEYTPTLPGGWQDVGFFRVRIQP